MKRMGAAFALFTLLVLQSCHYVCSSKESPADGSQKTGVAQVPQQLEGTLDPIGKETTAWFKHEPAAQGFPRRMGAGIGEGIGRRVVVRKAKGGRARGGGTSLRHRNGSNNGATSTASYLPHTIVVSFLASILCA